MRASGPCAPSASTQNKCSKVGAQHDRPGITNHLDSASHICIFIGNTSHTSKKQGKREVLKELQVTELWGSCFGLFICVISWPCNAGHHQLVTFHIFRLSGQPLCPHRLLTSHWLDWPSHLKLRELASHTFIWYPYLKNWDTNFTSLTLFLFALPEQKLVIW